MSSLIRNEQLLKSVLHRVYENRKQAQMTPEQVQTEAAAGGAPVGPPGAPPPPGAGVAPPVDPASGAPMDPAMAGGMPPGPPMPPPTIEDLVAAGDPIAAEMQAISKKLDLVIESMGQFMDNSGIQVPAGQALEAEAEAVAAAAKSPAQGAPKAASLPISPPETLELVDADSGEDDTPLMVSTAEPVSGLVVSGDKVAGLGGASTPGEGTKRRLHTGLADNKPRGAAVAELWQTRR